MDPIVIIDPGHGENTSGKQSPDGALREFRWAREISRKIVNTLRARGIDAELLVETDFDVPIMQRVERVNKVCDIAGAKNVVLVSVHVNAAGNGSLWTMAKGWSVFVSKNASDNSKKLAGIFFDYAKPFKIFGNRGLPKCKYWTWDWTVADIGILKYTKCPAVLTENMFMDNHDDCEYLLSDEGKQNLVTLHVNAITEYLNQLAKNSTK